MVAGFDGFQTTEHARFLSRELYLGNWILFARNIESYDQTAELCRELIGETVAHGGDMPFMTVDQEGGIVSRLHGSLNMYPGAMACAAAGGPDTSAEVAEITARHLRRLGFNMNLYPVADINSNPANPIIGSRSYGDQAASVSDHVLAAAQGSIRGGCVPVIKHFPGHGDVDTDSHKNLPLLAHSIKQLEDRELVPFCNAVEAGLPAVMIAHLSVPSLDISGTPASLSQPIIQGLLREKMGFQGLVLSDCMEMKGIQNEYSTAEAVLKALHASTDLFFISHTPQEQEAAFQAIYDEVSSGRISESRIDRSLERIQKAKQQLLPELLEADTPVPGWYTGSDLETLEDEHQALQKVSRNSITLIQDRGFLPGGRLPDMASTLILLIQRPERFIGEDSVAGGNPLLQLKTAFPASEFRMIRVEEIEKAMETQPLKTEKYDRILAVTTTDTFNTAVLKALHSLQNSNALFGIAAMRSPYEAARYPDADCIILGYENTAISAESLIDFLKGTHPANGSCPVTLPGLN